MQGTGHDQSQGRAASHYTGTGDKIMTEQKMQEKMVIANATMKMLEELEPIYDKYNGNSCDVARK